LAAPALFGVLVRDVRNTVVQGDTGREPARKATLRRDRDEEVALMDALAAAALGIVLAATAGLRAFLPVFSASLAAWMTDLPLPDTLAWLDKPQTVLIFGVATVLEILGDKIPVVDHALDSVQVLTKPVLAVLAATPFLYQLAPEYSVGIGILLGAPLALGVHSAKATARLGSTATTGGLGNPVLSVGEDLAAIASIILGFLAPLLALVLMAATIFFIVRLALRVRRRRRAAMQARG
jgi:hypothetical protein